MNSEFCRLCVRREKSCLVNALSIPELCKSVQCFLGLEILTTDKCSTFICRQCISIITESISYRNRVLYNQETIKEQLSLQLQLENVDIKTETEKEDDDDCIVIDSGESYQDFNIQPISFLQSSSLTNSTRPRLKRTSWNSTTKQSMMVSPPTKKICTRRLKVVCKPLTEKDVAHVCLDMKTQRLLKLNGKVAIRRTEWKETKKQMQHPIENDTKTENLSKRSNQSMLSGKVCVSGGTSCDISAAKLNIETNQPLRVEPIEISGIGSMVYGTPYTVYRAVKSPSVNMTEIDSIKVHSASDVIASQMRPKPATGTPLDKKNGPNSEQLIPSSAVNPRQPSSSKELNSVEAIKIENTKLPVYRIQSNALRPSSKQLIPNSPISKRILPKETLNYLHRKFINILPKPAGNLTVSPTLKVNIVSKSVGNLSASVTATGTEPNNVAITETPTTTTSPIVLTPNTSTSNFNYGVFRVPQTAKNIETTANGKLPLVNGRSSVSAANPYHIPASIIMSNNLYQSAVRDSSSNSSISLPSSPTVKSVDTGRLSSESRVKILTVNELNTRGNITQSVGSDIIRSACKDNGCRLPIRISLSRWKNEMVMKLFDSRGYEIHYQSLTEPEKEAVKIRLVSRDSIKRFNKAFQSCSPDTYTVELLNTFGLTVGFFKNSQI